MWPKSIICLIFSIFVVVCSPVGKADSHVESISEEQIEKATWMLHSWKVLGWQYDSPYWTKGSEEKGMIGQARTADPASKVRAVCLGLEEEHYVFFTLRSFVDPTFPNLFVQGVELVPRKKDESIFTDEEVANQSYVRYGGIALIHYADVGALHKIENKLLGVTQCEQGNPHSYGRLPGSQFLPKYYEMIDNVRYENPHQHISASQHLELQKKPKIIIKNIDEHDVALIYVPKHLFKNHDIDSLGMKNPTLAVKLMLKCNRELFGFKFVLIGQETLDLIKTYVPKYNEKGQTAYPGFQKIIHIVGLALGPETLHMIKIVDSAVDKKIATEVLAIKSRTDAKKALWDRADIQVRRIVNNKKVMNILRSYVIPKVTGISLDESG